MAPSAKSIAVSLEASAAEKAQDRQHDDDNDDDHDEGEDAPPFRHDRLRAVFDRANRSPSIARPSNAPRPRGGLDRLRFLYGLERSGDLVWRWQTPGAASFRPSSPAELYFRPSPYRLASNGRSALVAWWGSLWSVGPDGTTEWGLRLQDLVPPHVSEVRLRGRPSLGADALGVSAHASLREVKRAYREAVKQTHPDLHPDDPTATTRFRREQEPTSRLPVRAPPPGPLPPR